MNRCYKKIIIVLLLFFLNGCSERPARYGKAYIGMPFSRLEEIYPDLSNPKVIKESAGFAVTRYRRLPGRTINKIYYYFLKNKLIAVVVYFNKSIDFPEMRVRLIKLNNHKGELSEAYGSKLVIWQLRESSMTLYQNGLNALNVKIYGNISVKIPPKALVLYMSAF